MATVQSIFLTEAKDVVARFRQSGVTIDDVQAEELEREVEHALAQAWAAQRVRKAVESQLSRPFRSIGKILNRVVAEEQAGLP